MSELNEYLEIIANGKKRLKRTYTQDILQSLRLPASTIVQPSIGTSSAYGVILPLNGDNKKVLKMMIAGKADFDNEVRVGHIKDIEKVGTRI